jgi:hypothetical protein
MAGNMFGRMKTAKFAVIFRFQAVAKADRPVYQGTNNSIFQQRNFV